MLKVQSKLFCTLEVFIIWSPLIHSTKNPHETICVEAFALKFTNNFITFILQFRPKR